MRTSLAAVLATAVTVSGQQLPQVGGEQVYVTAIEVVADVRDAKGNLPPGLKPSDFVVIEDGVERTVVGLDYLRAARIAGAIDTTPEPAPVAAPVAPVPDAARPLWQNVIYFETTLGNGSGRATAAREMMKHVDTLTRMGTVDVVLANPTPVALVRDSRDAAAIRAALEKVATSPGNNHLALHRRQFLMDIDNLSGVGALAAAAGASGLAAQAGAGRGPRSMIEINSNRVLPYVDQEIAMITDFRESLMGWLSSYRRQVPRNLLLVTDGFDLNPVEFYGAPIPASAQIELRTYVSQSTLGTTATRLAESLAAGSWTTVSIPSDNSSDGWVDDATTSAIGRVHASIAGKRTDRPKALLIRPLDPLNAIAETTGGKVVPNSAHIGATLEGLDDRVKITYQVDRKPDGKPRKIEVRPRGGNLTVRAARVATAATSDELAQTRAAGLLKNASYLGDLTTQGSVEWGTAPAGQKSGTLRATTNVDLLKRLLPPGAKAQFRITMAVQVGGNIVTVNRNVDSVVADRIFRFRTPIDVPAGASMIAVTIEEITTGVWGGTRFPIPS